MKKSLFFVAAASALMLTACSSESDVLQSATPTQTTVQQQAVGFNVYTPAATGVTRAGLLGTMTTGRMQRSKDDQGGFGVYAYLIEDSKTGAGDGTSQADTYKDCRTTPIAPNFMVNEMILWDSESQGWYYNPLKYWPNETDNDSQNSNATMETSPTPYSGSSSRHLDRLSFFAYAPYVESAANEPGITMLTNNKGRYSTAKATDDPNSGWAVREAGVGYKASLNDPNKAVDLLWGVAPSGGLTYTAVNGQTVEVKEGEPLIDMTKPNVSTNMKFLFQHALARIGVTVVAAIDQVSPGGELDPNTKITINSLKLTGMFGETGNLNLDNTKPSVANWWEINGTAINNETTFLPKTTLTLTAENGAIAPHLCYAGGHTFGSFSKQQVVGVTTTKQDLISPSTKWFTQLASAPKYDPAKVYYTDEAGTSPAVAKYTTTKKGEVYVIEGGKLVAKDSGTEIDAPVYPEYNKESTTYYTVKEGETYSSPYPNGDFSYSPVRYSFESYGDPGCTNKYGKGVVEVVLTKSGRTQVEVLENTVSGFVGQKFFVDALTLDPNAIYQLYSSSDATTGLGIYVKNIKEVKYGYNNTHLPATTVLYKKNGTGTDVWYEHVGTKDQIDWKTTTDTYVTLNASPINVNSLNYAYPSDGKYYEAERNYFMVIPTNNVKTLNNSLTKEQEEALRTVRVEIEYYITTEDSKIAGGLTQTKNVITKDVVFPSIANGKSYNLNLVLGLTSVKFEAEVDDWKVENVQADLPQNTAE